MRNPLYILKVAIPVPVYRLFDYLPPLDLDPKTLKPGIRLTVPFGKGQKTAFLIGIDSNSEVLSAKLKRIEAVLDERPLLSDSDLSLLHWAARYYHHPLGEVFSAAFPVALRQGKPAAIKAEKFYVLTEKGRLLNPEQLRRAPKQQQLLYQLQTERDAVPASRLNAILDNWRPAAKALQDKQLLRLEGAAANATTHLTLNPQLRPNPLQQEAIEQVVSALSRFEVFLLEGVTGSGKTEVYMQVIRSVLERGQQVLVLLPEITLTPQLEQRFRQRFAVPITVSHSKLTDIQRQQAWIGMQRGDYAIMLGTRSALFTPLARPGLIILDEEHDASFKQQEGFRFSARDVAVVRGKLLNVPVLLGTATPSLESVYNVEQGRYRLLHLTERAGNAAPPKMLLLDIRNKRMQEGLSEPLIAEMHKTLAKNEQVLLFLNRRGFAPTLICHGCGWVARCRRCEANMVVHYDETLLRCHHCGSEQRLLSQCPECKTGQLTPLGLGTERVEKALAQLFPGRSVIRLDRDTTQRKGVLEDALCRINRGEVDIVLGTQMLAKGHHFPNVTLVVMLDVDSGLFSIDFHASEKLAQMIMQVSGRAGRAEKPGRVILQTRKPDHPLLTTLIKEGYGRFARSALAERRLAELPPYSFQALLRVEATDSAVPLQFFEQLMQAVEPNRTVRMLGPVPAPMSRRAGRYRYQLLLQSATRLELHRLLNKLMPLIEGLKLTRKVRWSLDVDPVDLY
ncbi:MAG: primosomal protein N' [Gammaproteobacteria bacterium HGW-Gammaproteobacteria-10]|nr:MAG: primosomal protein N' [Gammaproteobacteria bacterium HGW-Gammaproteobacteria-10]